MSRSPSPALPGAGSTTGLRLSVIIPFAADETDGAALLEQLQALPSATEILPAGVTGHALPAGLGRADVHTELRRCFSPAGRARQMNAAAARAQGRWLWFLHADSRLQPSTLKGLDTFIAADQEALGFFDLRYLKDGPWLTRLNAVGANLRARWLGMPFGDQGFVIPSAWFKRLGGYDESLAQGEDHALVWQARARGLRLQRIAAPLASSARKYATHGWLSTTAQSLALTQHQAWRHWRALRQRQAPRA